MAQTVLDDRTRQVVAAQGTVCDGFEGVKSSGRRIGTGIERVFSKKGVCNGNVRGSSAKNPSLLRSFPGEVGWLIN